MPLSLCYHSIFCHAPSFDPFESLDYANSLLSCGSSIQITMCQWDQVCQLPRPDIRILSMTALLKGFKADLEYFE